MGDGFLRIAREQIAKAIEIARQNKVVGHSLDVAVALALPETLRALVEGAREELQALSIVSRLDVVEPGAMDAPYASEEFPGLVIGVSKATGGKCNRCWMFSETVGSRTGHPALCERCCRSLES